MTSEAPTENVSFEDMGRYFADIRQGDIFELNASLRDDFGAEAVAISQTCDIVLNNRPTVLLAGLCTLTGSQAAQARRRDSPRYIHLEDETFVDLCHVRSVEKAQLFGATTRHGVDQDVDKNVRVFSQAVGRWFSRFAVPDPIVPWLKPLQENIRSKYDKPNSPLGQVLHNVIEIRLESPDWSLKPTSIIMHVIVKAGEIPTPDESEEVDEAFVGTIFDSAGYPKSPAEIAQTIQGELTAGQKAFAWEAFASALARSCSPKAGELLIPEISGAISSITGQLWSDDEFPLSRVRQSELLDLDHLSSPTPLTE
ncbi:hypothetical protein [Clavibacter sp. VKM Ac-2872]|uniref:hypothetical protein n=1 Tax=Clavibacter sp. VKM Ac-2872 TaxID=2783812 RepID=UPI00188C1B02|nr:hypothetical protein [Clavibacter sp. VKM Ac-2872]MBF4623085.1 hypothetical protein [Clavibacter sp. VKM Ac-2872]